MPRYDLRWEAELIESYPFDRRLCDIESPMKCRCLSQAHGHPIPCRRDATEADQLCKDCHQKSEVLRTIGISILGKRYRLNIKVSAEELKPEPAPVIPIKSVAALGPEE